MSEQASPFFPNTNIQYAWLERKANELLEKAIYNNGCFDCHLAPNAKGYCYVTFGRAIRLRVHRLICMVVIKRPLRDEELALHDYDNRRCIHPDHIFDGSALDNTADMIAKGRAKFVQPRTDHVHKENIIRLHNEGLNRFQIADRLLISPNTVWNYLSPKGANYVGE